MASRIVLHVGTAKSGTTALQNRLWENRVALEASGLVYPGLRPDSHYLAALDVLDLRYAGYDNPLSEGAWARTVEAARAAPRTAVISHELLSRADGEQVARMARDLDFAEVHVLVTVRHLVRQANSSWQENIRNGQTEPYEAFMAALTGEPGADENLAEVFDLYQDYPRILARWAAHLPADRLHVRGLTPGRSPWDAAVDVLGVGPDAADRPVTTPPNRSLGREQAELLRLVNERVRDRMGFREYALAVKEELGMQVLSTQHGAAPIRSSASHFEQLSRRHRHNVEQVRGAGYDVDPALDTLDPGRPASDDELARVRTVGAGLETAADALAGYLLRVAERHFRPDPVGKARAAVVDLVEVWPRARPALRLYLRIKNRRAARREHGGRGPRRRPLRG